MLLRGFAKLEYRFVLTPAERAKRVTRARVETPRGREGDFVYNPTTNSWSDASSNTLPSLCSRILPKTSLPQCRIITATPRATTSQTVSPRRSDAVSQVSVRPSWQCSDARRRNLNLFSGTPIKRPFSRSRQLTCRRTTIHCPAACPPGSSSRRGLSRSRMALTPAPPVGMGEAESRSRKRWQVPPL